MKIEGFFSNFFARIFLGPAKVKRIRDDIVEIVRKVFAIDGMSLVLTTAYTGAL